MPGMAPGRRPRCGGSAPAPSRSTACARDGPTRRPRLSMIDPLRSPLLTDLYQLTMLEAYFEHGLTGTAVFEFFVRRLPAGRGFLMAAGLEQALEYLEDLRFGDEELAWIRQSGYFKPAFADALGALRFTGDVDALPEGTV